MTDKLSKHHRSWVMSRVRGKNTRPERVVRSLLHSLGFRFTVNGPKNRQLPGRPDIVLPKRKTVVFVHGCFWHRHPECKHATTPQSNRDYWNAKFRKNVQRDRKNEADLTEMGWRVITIWECELKNPTSVAARLVSELPRGSLYVLPEDIEDAVMVAENVRRYRSRKQDP